MYRFLSRRPFKGLPLSASRLIHDMRPAYTAPPSYNTAFQPSNSDAYPQLLRLPKPRQEATDKHDGESVGNHETSREVNDYDVLFPDIKHETLETIVAEILGLPYLSEAPAAEAKILVHVAHGYTHGRYGRTIFPLIVTYKDEARWVFFIHDSGCPQTYLSDQARKALGIRPDMPKSMVTIGGHPSPAYKASTGSHFHDINLLGTDFCMVHGVTKVENYSKRRARLHFDRHVDVVQK
ncbi:hypothetical protein B9Z19DRAFT_1065998 [Tuber borchii]|uniref:Uncharacterized protein n=1 Tax=Tuber borchii TaxID=42251 RepID=A0A2T6ZP51_TUBBO|nr:hypothetical protein B9Z19DRAFT_1065998 [Tuber borchii]